VLSGAENKSAEEIIRNADIAMYAAKDKGKDRAEIFDPSMRKRFLDRLNIETELQKAIPDNELHVFYQPIVILETGKLIGFEALIRWQHPQKGLMLPEEFIHIAEETGLIFDIDCWVLEKACRQVALWNEHYKFEQDLTISINISGKHITNPELHENIKRILDDTQLNPGNLKLEITELTIVDQNEIKSRSLASLQTLGVQIQIDDFGIGYSSLTYLSRFPISALKIDQSFVSRIVEETSQRDIIKAIVNLTESLNVSVIAEGVETQEQVIELMGLGCELAQGFHFSVPLGKPKIEEMLDKISNGNGHLPT
jgi:EAL domain-containing protein (putative c-di-GMP-specific phosphodiesterase class I)